MANELVFSIEVQTLSIISHITYLGRVVEEREACFYNADNPTLKQLCLINKYMRMCGVQCLGVVNWLQWIQFTSGTF